MINRTGGIEMKERWTQEEINFITEYMGKHFEMNEISSTKGIIFMSHFLKKLEENKCGLMDWDYTRHDYCVSQAYFKGTLKECCDKIIKFESEVI